MRVLVGGGTNFGNASVPTTNEKTKLIIKSMN